MFEIYIWAIYNKQKILRQEIAKGIFLLKQSLVGEEKDLEDFTKFNNNNDNNKKQ